VRPCRSRIASSRRRCCCFDAFGGCDVQPCLEPASSFLACSLSLYLCPDLVARSRGCRRPGRARVVHGADVQLPVGRGVLQGLVELCQRSPSSPGGCSLKVERIISLSAPVEHSLRCRFETCDFSKEGFKETSNHISILVT
jgi:hypothetical protein